MRIYLTISRRSNLKHMFTERHTLLESFFFNLLTHLMFFYKIIKMINKEFPQIPGYIIKKKLGEGGMAQVYLAFQENLEREVAIKVLDPLLLKDEQILKRFNNEAQTAAKLNHLNIISIYDVGQSDDTYYIIMEYLKESLRDRMKPEGKLPSAEALGVIKKISEALAYAHSRGIIHRDIKPDNIMFRPDGTPVLVDFGIARVLNFSTKLTQTGVSIGTPYYMSPEQCRGEKPDGQSDIYSLGVVLFELLTGDVPYKSETPTGLMYLHIEGSVPKLPDISNKYQALIDKMMAKEKGTRIRNGAELTKLIELMEDNQILLSKKYLPKNISLHTHVKRKRLLLLVLIAVIFLVLIIYFLIMTPQNDKKVPYEKVKKDILKNEKLSQEHAKPSPGQQKKSQAFQNNIILAKKLFKSGEYEKALGKIKLLKNLQDTPGILNLEKMIREKLKKIEGGEKKDNDYRKYINLAKVFYKKGNYDSALINLKAARNLKETKELEEFEKELIKKKDEMLEEEEKKIEKEKRKVETVNFINLPREMITSMNKRMNRIEILNTQKGIIVGGKIELNLSVNEKGRIEIRHLDITFLRVNQENKKGMVKNMILKKISQISFKPVKGESEESIKIENWRKKFNLGTFQGKIILY